MSRDDNIVRTLFSGGSLIVFGLAFELGLSFVAKLFIARVLGPTDYGGISIGITILTMLSTAVLIGLNTGVARYLPRSKDESFRRGVLISAYRIVIPFAILVSLLIVILAPWLANDVFHNPSITDILRLFAAMIPLGAIMKLSVGTAQGMKQTLPKVYIQHITLPLVRFTGIIVVIWLGYGAIGVAGAYALAYLLASVIGVYYVISHTPLLSSVPPVRMDRELLSFSAPLLITTTMVLIFSDIDTFMLGAIASTSDVGIYNVVYPVAQLLTVATASFGFIFMPVVSELHVDGRVTEMRRLYQLVVKWVSILTFPLFTLVVLFPEMTISKTFGPEYASGALALSILSIGFFTHVVAGPNGNTLTSIGETRLIMYDNILVAGVNLGLNFLLIPEYTFLGAAVATAVAYVLLNLLYSIQLYTRTGIQPLSQSLVKPGVIAITVAGVLYLIGTAIFPITVAFLFGYLLVFTAVYAFAVIRFGIEEEEVMLVLSFEERFGVNLGPVKQIAQRFIE
ncbi:oligosaccharide flippase family protein [Haladaptatus sp. DJG-WS-42]|uniref:oligosaccharide flippase family protein n=1 Tax=Haladaptatus sp. DJG-WS-42 TaxID=3120516 RepID=UPI0030D516E5